jgi:uncharacterized protein YyaL (SSP411 family)
MSEVVIVGPPDDAATAGLLRAVEKSHQPFLVVVRVDPASRQATKLAALLPWIGGYGMRSGRPTAYVCRNFACDAPTTDPAELAAKLASSR